MGRLLRLNAGRLKEMKSMTVLKGVVPVLLVLVFCVGNMATARADKVDELKQALKDDDVNGRIKAAVELAKTGDKRAVEALIAALNDQDWTVQERAAVSLGKIGDKRAVEPLVRKLKDKSLKGVHGSVRWKATHALSEIGDKRAVEPLITALKDENKYVRSRAASALRKITGQRFRQDPEKWQKWWEENEEDFLKDR